MKKWYKICPYCWNEIKEWAIKCQYCKEFLKVEEPKKVEIKEDKTEKKVKKEKVEPKKTKKKQGNKINYSSIWWTIRNIFSTFRDLIKVIFSIWEKRISSRRWFIIYIFWAFFIFSFVRFISLIFWTDVYLNKSQDLDIFGVIMGILILLYLRGYILPKRAQDHWQPRYMWLIPILNIFYFFVSWDKGDNSYWEKPSFSKSIKNWWNNNSKLEKYTSILLFILIVMFVAALLPQS